MPSHRHREQTVRYLFAHGHAAPCTGVFSRVNSIIRIDRSQWWPPNYLPKNLCIFCCWEGGARKFSGRNYSHSGICRTFAAPVGWIQFREMITPDTQLEICVFTFQQGSLCSSARSLDVILRQIRMSLWLTRYRNQLCIVAWCHRQLISIPNLFRNEWKCWCLAEAEHKQWGYVVVTWHFADVSQIDSSNLISIGNRLSGNCANAVDACESEKLISSFDERIAKRKLNDVKVLEWSPPAVCGQRQLYFAE